MKWLLVFLALTATVAALTPEEEQKIIDDYNRLQAQKQLERRQQQQPTISTTDGDMFFVVQDGKRVGVKIGDKEILFNDVEQQTKDYADSSVAGLGFNIGVSMALPSMAAVPALEVKMDLMEKISESEQKTMDAVTTATDKLAQQVGEDSTFLKNRTDTAVKNLNTAIGNINQVVDDSIGPLAAGVKKLGSAINLASTCYDNKKNGDEADVDCGGSCAPCVANSKCTKHSDCQSNLCNNFACKNCQDTTSHTDCGGRLCVAGVGNGTICADCGTLAKHGVMEKTIKIGSGVDQIHCSNGVGTPAQGMSSYVFDTCGKLGKDGPSNSQCITWYSRVLGMQGTVTVAGSLNGRSDGGSQIWVAPMDGDYEWTLDGASGGVDEEAPSMSAPGSGGRVIALQAGVKKGTAFYIRVGQQGYNCITGDTTSTSHRNQDSCAAGTWINGGRGHNWNACGGYNGGGAAQCFHNPGGASGGGGTHVAMCNMGGSCNSHTYSYNNRFLVAGGGGGNAAENNHKNHGNRNYRYSGGNGGGEIGQDGRSCGQYSTRQGHRDCNNGWGKGGTQTAGGTTNRNSYSHGSSRGGVGQGGSAGQNDAGGGGGGYFGGAGADWNGGGGGGSSYIAVGKSNRGTITKILNRQGGNWGNGQVQVRIFPSSQ